jgi:LysR family nitrogen assimilation transcriptional regulator
MSLDLRQLRYFAAVAESGSFTRAAEALHVAQSALSLHVRRLEEALGVQLLIREPRGVRLTPAGARLSEHAKLILQQFVLAEQDIRTHYSGPAGPVAIGIPSGVGRVLTAPLIEAVKESLPRVSLQILEGMTGHLEEWLQQDRVALAVLYGDVGGNEAKEIARESLYLVSSSSLGPTGEVQLSDIPRHPLVLPSKRHSTRRCIEAAAQRHGCKLRVELELDSLSSIIDVVEQGRACSILAASAFAREQKQGSIHAYRIVDPPVERSVLLIAGSGKGGDPAVAAVKNLTVATAQRLVVAGEWPGTPEQLESGSGGSRS